MIVAMVRARVIGPRAELAAVLRALQDLGAVHLAPASSELPAALPSVREERERRHLLAVLDDVDRAIAALELRAGKAPADGPREIARWAREARRVRRAAEEVARRAAALAEERELIGRYRRLLAVLDALLAVPAPWPDASTYSVLLRREGQAELAALRQALARAVGDFELRARELEDGETALAILVPAAAGAALERALAAARVEEVPMPAAYGARSLAEAVPRMLERLQAIPGELAALRRERGRLAREHGAALLSARRALHDRLAELDALPLARVTPGAFVLEGWLPSETFPRLAELLARRCGERVAVSRVGTEEWAAEEAPVVLRNPRLLKPFEEVVKLLPLPRYGSIDPTPFVAVFFPMLFGLIVGDAGYGALLAALGLVLHRRSRPGGRLRAVAEIALACAVFSILFGFLYGELLGDLGRRWLGLAPVLFDREEAILPFLGLAVAIGGVHVLLGLCLGIAGALRHSRREALGRGLAAVMVLLLAAALLAAAEVLPRSFFTPAVVLLLAVFPVLVAVEGVIAPIELLATVGNVLSYARVMALGTASVMLAVVANRMVGAMGSTVVGVLFALLFHLVNFALGLFSPAIHALRLHYVEFFGKFYSPGGVRYHPFGHWTPNGGLAGAREASWKSSGSA